MIDGDDARPAATPPDTGTPHPSPASPDGRASSGRADEPAADADGSVAAARTHRFGYVLVLLGCAVFAWLLDQTTKLWVLDTMTEGQVTPVLPPLLQWRFFRNSGAAFSLGEGYTWVFTLIMIAVALFILLVLVRKVRSWWWAIGLGLLLGGTLGNLTDRLFRDPGFGFGEVIDFIALPNFAIFNLADSAIVSGVTTLCVLTLIGIGISGQRETTARRRTTGTKRTGAEEAGPEVGGTGDEPEPRR
ncbi:signal peptidase II [Tersicoccus phoenicis]|uniref:Lipoprotein signal peptidase n=1 Tax=Tersicoccus phoenicis TaxID=554083 RepID=A0A1R1L9T0_9MICC|nr:signal peptidase II [Tersicoccus phoenicis]OMH24278.1 signal peptidase II [Tersicoccus phoenicis]